MSRSDRGPTLTDAVGLGGVLAQDGFDYQVWEAMVRIPAWLANPAFEAVIFEGLEDVEARFFAPHVAPARSLLERVQAKSGSLGPADVQNAFQRFYEFEVKHPGTARVHILATQGWPTSLSWFPRDVARVRSARPFYAPFTSVVAASDNKLVEDCVRKFGDTIGRFAAASVEITERSLPSRDAALTAFGTALASAFPTTGEMTQRKLGTLFDALELLLRRSKGTPIPHHKIARLVEEHAGEQVASCRAVPLHVRSDRNGANETALEIDASIFSGGAGEAPVPGRWTSELASPLEATAIWLHARGVARIVLTGTYRLSTAFLLGYSFRSACGFDLEIHRRDGCWHTDDRPPGRAKDWSEAPPTDLDGGTLVVSLGVLRRPSEVLRASAIPAERMLDIHRATPVPDAKEAQASVSWVKETVDRTVRRFNARRIELYIAGPASFAVALGHRWNAMPPTTLYEFRADTGTYARTVTCG